MRCIRFLCLITALTSVLAVSHAWAQADDQDEDQVQLTAPMVENFIAAYGELASAAKDFARQYGDRSDISDNDPTASLPAYQDIPAAKARTTALLGKYDFKDIDQFEVVTNSVMLAYQADVPDNAATQSGGGDSDPDAEKAKAKADVEADQSLSPEQKKQALADIDQQYASLQDLTPLPGNADAVRPFLDRLKPIANAN